MSNANSHNETIASTPGVPLVNPISALHNAIEEANRFKQEMSSRLQKLIQQNGRLLKAKEVSDEDNRRLRAENAKLTGEKNRLERDNAVLLRNQQALDNAIQLACGTFIETTQYVSEATRSSIPTLPFGSFEEAAPSGNQDVMPTAKSAEPPVRDLHIERAQPRVSLFPAKAAVIAEEKPLSMVSETVEETSTVTSVQTAQSEIERMAQEIDDLLQFELKDLALDGDDIGAEKVSEEHAA